LLLYLCTAQNYSLFFVQWSLVTSLFILTVMLADWSSYLILHLPIIFPLLTKLHFHYCCYNHHCCCHWHYLESLFIHCLLQLFPLAYSRCIQLFLHSSKHSFKYLIHFLRISDDTVYSASIILKALVLTAIQLFYLPKQYQFCLGWEVHVLLKSHQWDIFSSLTSLF
jgi:hypothetical protein